jgi:hypothetical protein
MDISATAQSSPVETKWFLYHVIDGNNANEQFLNGQIPDIMCTHQGQQSSSVCLGEIFWHMTTFDFGNGRVCEDCPKGLLFSHSPVP